MSSVAERFESYENFLDHGLTEKDLFFLGNLQTARKLVTLGYRGRSSEENPTREEFYELKRKAKQENDLSISQSDSTGDLTQQSPSHIALSNQINEENISPFLREILLRQKDLKSGTLQTVVFLRVRIKGKSGVKENSGYIDLGHRLDTVNLNLLFSGKIVLRPRKGDLSFLDWTRMELATGSSPNFQVLSHPSTGLAFKSKRDRKILDMSRSGKNPFRKDIESPEYVQVAFFDNNYRKRY